MFGGRPRASGLRSFTPCRPPLAHVLIDSSVVKAHRSASGGSGEGDPGHWSLSRRADNQDPRPDGRCLPSCRILHADKVYDTNHIRRTIEAGGHDAQHPAQSEPDQEKLLLARPPSRDRNAIERMLCRLKNFRRVATRYDRLAINYVAAVLIAATVVYWL